LAKQECSKQPFNLNTVNQTIKDCLDDVGALSNKFSNVDQINIIVELSNLNIVIMAMINPRFGQTCLQQQKLGTDPTVSLISNQVNYYNKKSPKPNCDKIPEPFYQSSYRTYHIPLYCDEHLRSAIEFITASNQDFTAADTIAFGKIAHLIENIFKGFSIMQHLSLENSILNKAHLEDHILVDVTNIIVSTHHLDTIIQLLSKAIIEFFAIDSFHHALAKGMADLAKIASQQYHSKIIVLSGGVLQNKLLRKLLLQYLSSYTVYTPKYLPCNDGGISFGQAIIAAAKLNAKSIVGHF